jgi:hypothetical protein
MGLRIVDRQFRVRTDITDAERLAGIESEARRWAALRGGGAVTDSQDFVTHFREVRSRLSSPDRMAEMAHKIRDDIKGRTNDSALSHNQVDIATLLELL